MWNLTAFSGEFCEKMAWVDMTISRFVITDITAPLLPHRHLFHFLSKSTSFQLQLVQLGNFPSTLWGQSLLKYPGHCHLPSQRPDSFSCLFSPRSLHIIPIQFQICATTVRVLPSLALVSAAFSAPPNPASQPSWKRCSNSPPLPHLSTDFRSDHCWNKSNSKSLFCPHFTVGFRTYIQEAKTKSKTKVQDKGCLTCSSRNFKERF